MTSTLIYSPQVTIHIATIDGRVLDVSDDIVSGSVTRRINAISQMNVTLLNQGRKYDGLFTPMDRIVVYLKRITNLLEFSGYLDAVPAFSAYAGSIVLQASCTLKRIQNFYWDPDTSAAQQLWAGDQVRANKYEDGGMALRTIDTLNKVAGWPQKSIHIGAVPTDWFRQVSKVADALVAEAKAEEAARNIGASYTDGKASDSTDYTTASKTPLPGNALTGTLPNTTGRATWFSSTDATGDAALYGKPLNQLPHYYCAMRWPYVTQDLEMPHGYTLAQVSAAKQWWKGQRVIVVNAKTHRAVCVYAADWGPNAHIQGEAVGHRIIDLDKKAFDYLAQGDPSGCDQVNVGFAPDGTKLGPLDPNSASGDLGSSLAKGGVQTDLFDTKNPRTVDQAIAYAKGLDKHPCRVGSCMSQVGKYYGYASSGWNSPTEAWHGTGGNKLPDSQKHPLDRKPPPGALLWYDSPHQQYGHIILYLGNGMMASTDYPTAGQIGVASVHDIENAWRQTYLGWTQPYFPYGDGPHTQKAVATSGDPGLDTSSPSLTGTASGDTGDSGDSGNGDNTGLTMGDVGTALFNVAQWISQSDYGGDLLAGPRALANDKPLLETIDQYMSTGLRHYCSAPNGDFIAWFPDYFGHYHTAAKMVVRDIEIQRDFAVAWSDQALKTHVFVTSSHTGVSGFQDASNVVNLMETAGIAAVEYPEIMDALFVGNQGMFDDHGKAFLNRYGARPYSESMDNISGHRQEFFFACHIFMENWAQQFSARVDLTFMPEIYVGMLLVLPTYGMQAYVQEVTHSFDLSSSGGFTTTVTCIGWSGVGKSVVRGLPRGAEL